jgi:beta-galactosidase
MALRARGFAAASLFCGRSATLYLDTRGWGKGAASINGHALGRFWNLGPQQTLYGPASWLRKGTNDVVVFTKDQPSRRIRGLRAPVLDEVGRE